MNIPCPQCNSNLTRLTSNMFKCLSKHHPYMEIYIKPHDDIIDSINFIIYMENIQFTISTSSSNIVHVFNKQFPIYQEAIPKLYIKDLKQYYSYLINLCHRFAINEVLY